MAGNTLGDLLKADQFDLLKQVSSENKSSSEKPVSSNVVKTNSDNHYTPSAKQHIKPKKPKSHKESAGNDSWKRHKEKHAKKAMQLKEILDSSYKELGITNKIVALYKQENYKAIYKFFRSSLQTYFNKQQVLGMDAFIVKWNKAHKFMAHYIGVKKYAPHRFKGLSNKEFKSHQYGSDVWSEMAKYGGTHGPFILINAGHGKR